MREYLVFFRPFLLFLTKFFAVYLLLAFLYHSYLSRFDSAKMEVDGITRLVACQAEAMLGCFGQNAAVLPNPAEPGLKLFYNGKWVARIIEGCNAVSIMVLFVSFIIAFTGKFKPTLFFILGGLFVIHIFNIIRIALLAAAIFHYPEQEHWLHGVVFPLVIYGVVFGLWLIWVNKFSFYAEKNK